VRAESNQRTQTPSAKRGPDRWFLACSRRRSAPRGRAESVAVGLPPAGLPGGDGLITNRVRSVPEGWWTARSIQLAILGCWPVLRCVDCRETECWRGPRACLGCSRQIVRPPRSFAPRLMTSGHTASFRCLPDGSLRLEPEKNAFNSWPSGSCASKGSGWWHEAGDLLGRVGAPQPAALSRAGAFLVVRAPWLRPLVPMIEPKAAFCSEERSSLPPELEA